MYCAEYLLMGYALGGVASLLLPGTALLHSMLRRYLRYGVLGKRKCTWEGNILYSSSMHSCSTFATLGRAVL